MYFIVLSPFIMFHVSVPISHSFVLTEIASFLAVSFEVGPEFTSTSSKPTGVIAYGRWVHRAVWAFITTVCIPT